MNPLAQIDWASPASTSLLAFVTTIHVAMTVLLKHKQPGGRANLTMLPSLALTFSPWLLGTPAWIATALASHVAWLSAAGRHAKRGQLVQAASTPRPAPASERPAMHGARPVSKGGFVELPVLAVITETPEIRTFRVARPDGFEFVPGQFLMVKVALDGRDLVRCYSISSSPAAKGYLEISVKRQGQVSGFLHATIGPGMTLRIGGPGGTFVYPEGSRPIVLLAGGIGITPLLSMARHALSAEPTRQVTLVVSARTEASLPFADELELLARRHPRFRLVVAVSGGTGRQGFFSGRIDGSLLDAVVEHVTESVYMICGPLAMIDAMTRVLVEIGVPAAQIQSERFENAVADAEKLAASSGRAGGDEYRVTLQRRGCALAVRAGQSILDAADEAGEELPSMCRAGVCGSCRTRLIEGEVDGEFPAIDDNERAEGFVLACVAMPVTDCVLDA